MSPRPSDYERRARAQISEWKKPEQGWFGQTMRQVGWPLDRLGTLITHAGAAGLYGVVNDALAGTVGWWG